MILQNVLDFLMKFKHEVVRVFMKFKKMVENQSGCKTIGKEYTSAQFNQFCGEIGIEHQLTTPYTTEKIGVSERRNISMMEMTRRMLHKKELLKPFWAKHDKLDKKAITSIFMDYSSISKAYKVYHPQTRKMTITRDVYFNEGLQ
ncbi:hypothetical protein CR513_33907, partial [Mucuna pruriens]